MPKISTFCFAGVISGIMMLLFSGCTGTSKPSQFYLLSSMESPAVTSTQEATDSNISIGLGPVTFPEYLNRPQIVLRTLGSEIKVADFHRWAEPLQENFTQVLAQNLVILLNTESVWLFPWSPRIKVDYQVALKVERFDAVEGKQAELNARWTIFSVTNQGLLRNGRAVINKDIKSNDVEDIVAAQNEVLMDLSKQLAEEIEMLYAEQ